MNNYHALAKMLDEVTGPSRELDCKLYDFFWGDNFTGEMCFQRDFTASIDAALALVEQLLPEDDGWFWECGLKFPTRYAGLVHPRTSPAVYFATIWRPKCDLEMMRRAPTAPLAILKALVAALIAVKEKNDEA